MKRRPLRWDSEAACRAWLDDVSRFTQEIVEIARDQIGPERAITPTEALERLARATRGMAERIDCARRGLATAASR